MLKRREFLARLPAAPIALVTAVSQAPNLIRSLPSTISSIPYQAPVITVEDRLAWFMESLEYIVKPTLPNPRMMAAVVDGVDYIRAIVQWENYVQNVTHIAEINGVPLEQALELAEKAVGG